MATNPEGKKVMQRNDSFIEDVPDIVVLLLYFCVCTMVGFQIGWNIYEPSKGEFYSIADATVYMAYGATSGLIFGILSGLVLYAFMRKHAKAC